MNALVATPLREAIVKLAAELGRVADEISHSATPLPQSGDVVERLLTIRAGLVGVDQPNGDAADFVAGKVEGLEVAISMLGGKVPKEKRRKEDGFLAERRRLLSLPNSYTGTVIPSKLAKVSGAGDRLLHVLRVRGPQTRAQLAIASCYSVRSGSYAAALARLREEALVSDGEDGRIELTPAGTAIALAEDDLPEPAEILEHWALELGAPKGGRLLELLVEDHPFPVTRAR